MARNRVAATLRSTLFNSSSVICLSKARHLLLPLVAGAAFALGGTAFTSDALAAAGACAPDANGTSSATGPTESCSGDFATGIGYPGALGTGGNFEVDLNSVTNVTDGGVIVSGGGAVNVTVTQFAVPGNISNLAGNGIEATTLGGNISITTVGGNVTASAIGVYGEQLLAAGSGSVTISVAGNIRGGVLGAGAGIVGQVQGDIGNVLITTADGTVVSANGYTALVDSNVAIYASAPDGDANEIAGNVTVSLGNFTAVTLTNALNGAGISADTFGDAGNVNVTLGNGATITLNDGTGNDASGIYAVAQDAGNLITGNVAVTLNNSLANHTAITVSGDNNTAITARSEGNGSVTINTGANNDLSVTGETSFGIWATGGATGTGNISVTTGAGSDIAVNAGDGLVGANYGFSAGIRAQSNGGNVAVTTAGNVTVSGFSVGINPTFGILASTNGGGSVSVIAGGTVTSQWGAGIAAASLNGNITVTSTGPISAGGFGIQAVSSGNGTVAVEAPTTAIINAGTAGIYAASTGGNVSVGSSAYIGSTFTGATDAGIRAVGNTGTVSVQNAGNMSALSGASFGIVATSTTGGIAVTNLAQIGAAGAGNGINSIGIAAQSFAANNVGGISIVNSNKIYMDSTGSTVGIFASNVGSGPVSVTNYGDIDQPVTGINGSGAGDVNVTNHGAAVSATVFGINSFSSGGGSAVVFQNMTTTTAGNVTSFNNPNVTVSAGTFGIIAQSIGGNVLVSGTGRDLTGNGTTGDDGLAGNVTLTDGLGNGTAIGILASASANGNATVRLASASAGNATFGASTRGTVTVGSADAVTGIGAATQAGDINVLLLDNTVAGGSITVTSSSGGAGNAGISAIAVNGNSTTSGSVVINTGNFNNISVSGDNSVGVLGQSSYGNVSITTGANASLTVAANSSGGNEAGYIGGSYGIVAGVTNGGTGNVTVNSNAVITVTNNAASSTIGIRAANSGGGTLNVIANAAITSNGGSAIAAAGGTGPVGISNSASIRGLGTSAGTAVVNVSSVIGNATTGNITINNNATGVIASVGGFASDLAIGATTSGTGIVTINNAGRITGAVDLSGAGASVFNNTSATSWHTSGASTFTGGSDTLTNFSTGRLATSGATTFNFLGNAGLSDVINNLGTLVVGETSGASSLSITKGNGTFVMSNSGTIILGGQSTGLNTDGQTNDQLLGKGANMTFLASGSSRLKIDAFLGAGAEAQSSAGTGCGLTAAFADCMTIGSSTVATGSTGTRVSINDTNSAGSGAINLPGTVIVDGTSGAAGDFFLSTADTNVVNTAQGLAVRKGFVLYQLVFDSTNVDWDLVGMPAAETFELSKVTAGLQTVWHETADGWNERTSAIRHDFAADTMVRAWTIWGKAYYGQASRDSDNAIVAAGTPFTFDTTYTQSYGGIQFGADVSRRTANGAWALGGLIGYNKTRVEFDASSDSIDGTVVNIGAYGSFMAGPFFADLLVKDDFATLDFDLPAYAGVDNVDANSIGAELTFGGRFGRRIVFEPLGTLAYVKTAVGNLDSAGMNFNWEDGTSFRGIFALRLSGEFGPEQTRLQPFILGGIGREFDGENNLLLTTGGSSLSIMDKPIETFGVASLGLNVLGTSGWSGFIRADGLFGPDYHSAAIRVGMRIR